MPLSVRPRVGVARARLTSPVTMTPPHLIPGRLVARLSASVRLRRGRAPRPPARPGPAWTKPGKTGANRVPVVIVDQNPRHRGRNYPQRFEISFLAAQDVREGRTPGYPAIRKLAKWHWVTAPETADKSSLAATDALLAGSNFDPPRQSRLHLRRDVHRNLEISQPLLKCDMA